MARRSPAVPPSGVTLAWPERPVVAKRNAPCTVSHDSDRRRRGNRWPTTIDDASAEIARLKTVAPSNRAERRDERKDIADQIHASMGDATRIRDDEICGHGADAAWSHHLNRPDDTP